VTTFIFGIIGTTLFALSTFWTTIEPASIFGVFAFWVLSLCIKKPHNYFSTAIWVITFGTFIRATILVLLPLVLIYFIIQNNCKKIKVKNFIPLIVLIPYIVESGYQNLSSSLQGNRYADPTAFTNATTPTYALLKSVISQFSQNSLLASSILVILLLIIKSSRLLVAIYLIVIFTIYAYLVPHSTQGMNKYALETTIPLLLIGLAALLEYSRRTKLRSIYAASLVLLVSCYLQQVGNQIKLDEKIDGWGQASLITNYPIRNFEAYKYIRSTQNLRKDCYNPGVTYGVLPFFLAGFSKSDLSDLETAFNRNFPTFKWGSKDVDVSRLDTNCLIIDNYPLKKSLYNQLTLGGWKQDFSTKNSKLGTEVSVWTRSL
jgi:hypothetical protein